MSKKIPVEKQPLYDLILHFCFSQYEMIALLDWGENNNENGCTCCIDKEQKCNSGIMKFIFQNCQKQYMIGNSIT